MNKNETLTVYRKMYLIHDSLFDKFEDALNFCDGKDYINSVFVKIDDAEDLYAETLDATQYNIGSSMEYIDFEMTELLKEEKSVSWAYTINSGPEKKHGKEIQRLPQFLCWELELQNLGIIAREYGYDTSKYDLSSNQIVFTNSMLFPDYNLFIEFMKSPTVGSVDIILTKDAYLIKKD
ncbi:hypothetical protein P4U97_01210 [Bacillus swezeyi]|uniref:hypothetical protein n=1 Tax=Bacillus swezeyi TaxID=1925020 RepID=UPI002E218D4E|nr:hypothetical protein [Bacillus swezeyi]